MSLLPPIAKPNRAHLAELPREIKVVISYIEALVVPIIELFTSVEQKLLTEGNSFEINNVIFPNTESECYDCVGNM
jgi:hypothetical protein